MNKFEGYKEKGLSQDAERNFNIIRGVILGSFLETKDKRDLIFFLGECEDYFNSSNIDEED